MTMGSQLRRCKRHRFYTNHLGKLVIRQPRALTHVNRHPAAQVGKSKSRLTITTVSRPDQLEKNFVLGNRKQLSVTKHPTRRRKISGEHSDFTYIGLTHFTLLIHSLTDF